MMRTVKNALGIADTTASSNYGTTVPLSPMGTGLQGSQLGYGSSFGGSSLGSSGFASPALQTQVVQSTTTIPINAASPVLSQAPLTPTQSFSQSQYSLPVQKQFQQGFVQRRETAPVVHERIRREEVEEVQPVIHRERERTEVHKIIQPIQSNSTLGIITEEGTLPAQFAPEVRTPGMMAPPAPIGSREQLSGQRMRVEKPAMIIETEKKNIIEEVQPVVYKEIVEPHIIRLTQPIYERIVEGEVYFNETLPAQRQFLPQQQFQQQQFPQQQFQQFPQQQSQQQLLQPIEVQTIIQPVPVPVQMASPLIGSQLPLKQNLEVAATYVKDFPSDTGRYGSTYSKGSAYAYGPGSSLAQPRAV